MTAIHSSPCNSFPKILGGSTQPTDLYQIDVFNDYLALAGSSRDSTLTGVNIYLPLLVLSSISTGGKYYWAKALSLKLGKAFLGVYFSSDGSIIIAHSGFS